MLHLQRNTLLAFGLALAVQPALHAESEPYVEITSTSDTGQWQFTLSAANEEDEKKVWVDLNGNQKRDEDEGIGIWDWQSYRRERTSKTLRIYGPLVKLNCSYNKVSQLQLAHHPQLMELECAYAEDLTGIDLTANTGLKKVNLAGCSLSEIKLPTENAALETLDLNQNKLATLSITGCTKLQRIDLFNNRFAPAALHTLVEQLPMRSVETKGRLVVRLNPRSQEPNAMLKSDVEAAKEKHWETVYFDGYEAYPGVDSEAYVTTLPKTLLTRNTDSGEWKVAVDASEEDRKSVWIDYNHNNLYDFGEEIVVFGTSIDRDLSGNTLIIYGNLSSLNAGGNKLTEIDITALEDLKELNVAKNQLTQLDLSKATKLTDLLAFDNLIAEIDLSHNEELGNLALGNNKLSRLDLDICPKLKVAFISQNQLTHLNLAKSAHLQALAFDDNQLTSVFLGGSPELESLYCRGNQLSYLDLWYQKKLKLVSAEKNQLLLLQLPQQGVLTDIYCFSNRLSHELMTSLMNQLPQCTEEKRGSLFVIDSKDENEQNRCTRENAAVAKGKHWTLYDYKGKENNGKNPYEGGEPSAITSLESASWDAIILSGNELQLNCPTFLAGNPIRVYDMNGQCLWQGEVKGEAQTIAMPQTSAQALLVAVGGETRTLLLP